MLEGIEACRSVQRSCPTATSLEAQDAPGNVRRKAASWAGGLCAASNLRTRNAESYPPALGEKIACRADGSACGTQRLDSGDNTLKDKRRAATEGARRDARRQPANLEGKNPERRGSDASAIPDLDYQVFRAPPSPQGKQKSSGRTTRLASPAGDARKRGGCPVQALGWPLFASVRYLHELSTLAAKELYREVARYR